MSLPTVNQFKNRLALGGARGNYYVVNGPTIGADMSYLARAASLPAANVNQVEVMTPGGRKLKFAGERTFEDWTVSVYNDTAMITRKKFENWQRTCADYGNPLGADALNAYGVSNWSVTQLSRSGIPVKSYNFYNMWPSGLGAIELSFDEQSNIEQFDVTFAFSHYEPGDLSLMPVNLANAVQLLANAFGTIETITTDLSGAVSAVANASNNVFAGAITDPPTSTGL
jgi:hypothetical protein